MALAVRLFDHFQIGKLKEKRVTENLYTDLTHDLDHLEPAS